MNTSMLPKKIAVIGAGWAGLSAALTLAQSGAQVTLFERSPHLGGRAARAYPAGAKAPFALDNGQHVMIGAYAQVLALLRRLGVNADKAFAQIPPQWVVLGQMEIRPPPWLASSPYCQHGPFKQLPMAAGLLREAWAHSGFGGALAATLAAVRMKCLPPKLSETVDEWLLRTGWSERHCALLWRPLCAATLNTSSHIASARTFARVVQDGLMAGPKAASMLLPRGDLSDLVADPAQRQLLALGADIRLHSAVVQFETHAAGVMINGQMFDRLVIATPPKDAWRLLAPHAAQLNPEVRIALRALAQQDSEPICTLHWFAGQLRLTDAVLMLPDGEDAALNNAVLIDRSYLAPDQAGWFTLVISSSHAALLAGDEASLLHRAITRLQSVLPQYVWNHGGACAMIHAKQATFSCTATTARPASDTGLYGVYLAGDYVQSPENYPATLEGAVRSGTRVAARALAER